jgi:hypothetical protein
MCSVRWFSTSKSAAVDVEDSHHPPSKNTLPEIRKEIAEPPSQKQMMDALAAEGTPQEEAEIALYDVTQSMSLFVAKIDLCNNRSLLSKIVTSYSLPLGGWFLCDMHTLYSPVASHK